MAARARPPGMQSQALSRSAASTRSGVIRRHDHEASILSRQNGIAWRGPHENRFRWDCDPVTCRIESDWPFELRRPIQVDGEYSARVGDTPRPVASEERGCTLALHIARDGHVQHCACAQVLRADQIDRVQGVGLAAAVMAKATYAIHGGTTAQCETLGPRLAEIRADPHLVSGLRSREQLDTEHWQAHSKLSVGPELSQVPLQNEFFNPDNPRLYFIVELDLRKIETVEIDCAKRTITLLLAWP